MDFFTVSKNKRPIRLSEGTRQFAYDSLNHKYGIETYSNYSISMDNVDDFENMDDITKYDIAIRKIANEAPLRICEGELLSGAATLGAGINHEVPISYNNEVVFYSVSHLTINFENVIKKGINGIKEEINDSIKKHTNPNKLRFLESCKNTIECIDIYRRRYVEELKKIDCIKYSENIKALSNVPFNPPKSFREAIQSVWFIFSFVRLTGNWPGIGRLDYLIGSYLENDFKKGVITLNEARELVAHFFIKGCEWVRGGCYGSGDAQHYQNLVISGIDEKGNDVTNTLTYLILDVIEELGISDFPTTVRLNKNTDEKLYRRCAEVMRFGGGILAFYNEDEILDSLEQYGYSKTDAVKFANDGCWEIQIPGKTYFTYCPFDSLEILQSKTLKAYQDVNEFENFEDLFSQYLLDLDEKIHQIASSCLKDRFDTPYEWKPTTPCTVVSIFEDGCIKKGLSYLEGGPVYNVFSPHIGGLADTVNSLYAIKKMVFDEKIISINDLAKVLSENWENNESLRQYALNSYSYYGNDNDECDDIAVKIVDRFANACKKEDGICGYNFPAGISTFGRQLQWLPHRLASPHGHKKEDVLAGNTSPTPGSDKEGATAIIKSYCKSDLSKMVTGAALDLRLLPSYIEGEDGILMFELLLKGFQKLGGNFVQPDIQSADILYEAQKCPENFQTLSVRVSGWNARFVTLNKEWQDMIINEVDK